MNNLAHEDEISNLKMDIADLEEELEFLKRMVLDRENLLLSLEKTLKELLSRVCPDLLSTEEEPSAQAE